MMDSPLHPPALLVKWELLRVTTYTLSALAASLLLTIVAFGAPTAADSSLLRQGEAEQVTAAPLSGNTKAGWMPKVIVMRQGASEREWLAANEVRRFVYLRTGKLLPVKKGVTGGDRIVVSCKSRPFCGDLGQDLGAQQFTLKTVQDADQTTWWVVGGDETGTLYGAYRFAEKLGVRFALDEDILPDEPLNDAWPLLDETGKPRFSLRGLQPFHDFSVGPDWWNLQDYQHVLSQMVKLRMNFLGLHTYPSWNPSTGPEANVWIGLPEDVDAKGNVKRAYEAGVMTTRRGWAVTPYPTSKYAVGASLLFEKDDYGPDFMLDCLDWPKTEDACVAMFNRYGDFQQKAFKHARRLGISTCIGTEIPLGVPPMLVVRLKAQGLNPDDPTVIRRLYEGTFLRLMRKTPVDYYWLWTPEIGSVLGVPGWEMVTTANFERDLAQVEAAAKAVQAPFALATSGWRLGVPGDPLWMHRNAPKVWPASSINPECGGAPVEKQYGEMPGRPKWAIGWAEDDGSSGAACCTCLDLQLWVERMFRDSSDAFRYGCEGMMAIHWRTAAIAPNIAALAQAGWNYDGSTIPDTAPALDAFWADWGRVMFGGGAGAEAGRILKDFDGKHPEINSLYDSKTTDEQISTCFAPLQRLESLRPSIQGTGNLERLDYWIDQIKATRARAQTWVLAERLTARIGEANAVKDPREKTRFIREQVLPLRLAVARSHEEPIAAFLNGTKSPGEVGVIAHMEYGVRDRLVSSRDAAIQEMLGEPLPAEAAVNTAYRGKPRIFVPAKRTQVNGNEPQEMRAFVLSGPKCTGVSLHWRVLGGVAFKTVAAARRARQAYCVHLPAQTRNTLEYYLEASLEDGQRVRWPATAPAINQTVIAW